MKQVLLKFLGPDYRAIHIILAVVAVVFGFIVPAFEAFRRNESAVGAGYILFLFAVAGLIWYLVRLSRPSAKAPAKKIFGGVGDLTADQVWQRTEQKNALVHKIKQSSGRPIVLVGSSGAGKSVLLSSQVVPTLKADKWLSITFTNYGSSDEFKSELLQKLPQVFPSADFTDFVSTGRIGGPLCTEPVLLIFDQFEQFISLYEHNRLVTTWFSDFVANTASHAQIRYIIVVRKEWYYDLKFLSSLVPPPHESVHISGFSTRDHAPDFAILRSQFLKVTKDEQATDCIIADLTENGEILPVKAQIVGLMLENSFPADVEIDCDRYRKQLGGVSGLFESYARSYANSAPNPELTIQVLFTLSIETRFRSQLKASQIAGITHKTDEDVSQVLEALVKESLVRKTDTGEYQLAHDFLAELFHDFSGSEIDPAERDNIVFFWEHFRRSHTLPRISPALPLKGKAKFSDYFLTFLVGLLVVRLISPYFGLHWEWFNPLYLSQSNTGIFDIYYLPVFISHMAWSIYVALLYRRTFSMIDEGRWGRVLSKATVVNCTMCVVAAVFVPHWWICSIAWGGIIVGTKLWQLSRTISKSRIAAKYYRHSGLLTIVNLVIVMLLGLALIYVVHSQQTTVKANIQVLLAIQIFLAFLLTYFMLVVRSKHVTRSAASRILGLLERGQARTH